MDDYSKIILAETKKLLKTGALKTIIDSEPIGIAVLMPIKNQTDLIHVYVNPAYQELVEKNPVGRSFAEIWPHISDTSDGLFGRISQSGGALKMQDIQVNSGQASESSKETNYFTFEFSLVPVDGENRIMAVVEDTTDEVQARRSLAVNEERYRLALNNAPVIAATVNTDLRYEWIVNPHPAFDPITVIGKRDDELAPAEWVAELVKFKESVLRSAKGDRRIIPIVVQGKTRYYDIAAEPIVNDEGQVKGLSTATIDVTDLKQTEESFKASEAKYRELFTSINEATAINKLIRDDSGKVVDYIFLDVNPTWERMSGISRDKAIGKTAKELFSVVEDYWLDAFDRVMQTGKPANIKEYGGGMERYYSVNIWKLSDKRFAHTFSDITDIKRAQEALREKDAAIRKAYTEVFEAATGGRLILLSHEEIQPALGKPITKQIVVSKPEEMKKARQNVKNVLFGEFGIEDLSRYIDPFGEALTNAVKHAGGGTYQVYRKADTVQIKISDKGPGIDFGKLPKATLEVGYSTAGTLGRGFNVMLNSADRVLLSTQPGNTTVILETSL